MESQLSIHLNYARKKGSPINYVDKQWGGRGSHKCQRYYISLFSKLVNKGGGVERDLQSSKVCQRSLWMPPYATKRAKIFLEVA